LPVTVISEKDQLWKPLHEQEQTIKQKMQTETVEISR
jgi:hypothetical protein